MVISFNLFHLQKSLRYFMKSFILNSSLNCIKHYIILLFIIDWPRLSVYFLETLFLNERTSLLFFDVKCIRFEPERDLADGMTSGELDDLSGRRVLRVHLQRRQLQRGVRNLRIVANETRVAFKTENCKMTLGHLVECLDSKSIAHIPSPSLACLHSMDDNNTQSEPVLVGNGRRKNESRSCMLS